MRAGNSGSSGLPEGIMPEKRPVSTHSSPVTRRRPWLVLIALCVLCATLSSTANYYYVTTGLSSSRVPFHAEKILDQCAGLRATPGPPTNFYTRQESDRFEPEANSTFLIRNATIWTGERNGTVTVQGDLLLDRGIIKGVGDIPDSSLVGLVNLTVVDAQGAWLTPGLGIRFKACSDIYILIYLEKWTYILILASSAHPFCLVSHKYIL
jgi:hypothetical protein